MNLSEEVKAALSGRNFLSIKIPLYRVIQRSLSYKIINKSVKVIAVFIILNRRCCRLGCVCCISHCSEEYTNLPCDICGAYALVDFSSVSVMEPGAVTSPSAV